MMTSFAESRLLEELDALRERVEQLEQAQDTQPRITLNAVQAQPFVGQTVTLNVRAADGRGLMPLPNLPVTVMTTWGRLRLAGAYEVQGTTSLTGITGADGILRVALLPPTAEDLTALQQEALEAALQNLKPDAATPRETEEGFTEMARQYDWEVSFALRKAVDIYFRDFGRARVDTVNALDPMRVWGHFNSTVLAFAQPRVEGVAGAPVASAAALTLAFKDWLAPWLETYRGVVDAGSELPHSLGQSVLADYDAGGLLDHVYRHLNSFVEEQHGLVGEYIGRRVAADSVNQFLLTGLEELDPETRVSVFPALKVASSTIVQVGPAIGSAVAQTRADLRKELDFKVTELDPGRVTGRLDLLDALVADKIGRETFETALADKVGTQTFSEGLAGKLGRGEFEAGIEGKADRAFVEDALRDKLTRGEFDAGIAGKADREFVEVALRDKLTRGEFDAGIAGKADREFVEVALRGTLTRGEFDTAMGDTVRREEFEGAVRNMVDRGTFKEALASKVDQARFNEFEVDVNKRLEGRVGLQDFENVIANLVDRTTFEKELEGKVGREAFGGFESTVNTRFDQKVDMQTFTGYRTEVGNIMSRKLDMNDFTTTKRGLDTQFNDVVAAINRLNKRVFG